MQFADVCWVELGELFVWSMFSMLREILASKVSLETSRNQLVIANWHGFEQPVKQTIYEQLVSEAVCPNQPVERVLVIVLTTYFMYGAT
jgi:hypothetical protein